MNTIRKIGAWLASSSAFFFASVVVVHAAANDGKFENILNPAFSTVPDFIAGVLKAVVIIALPIITLFFVVSGFMFLFAQGNQTKLENAKKNFLYVVIGALLIMGAWVIATLIAGTVTQLVGKS